MSNPKDHVSWSDADAEALLRHAKTDLDWNTLADISRNSDERRRNKVKYLDAEKWLRRMWGHAVDLDLHRLPRQQILDLGTGPGYFPYVCRVLGHEAWALDQPGMPLHDRLSAWLGVQVIPHTITAQTPLPSMSTRFDVVTAHRVGFNSKGKRGNRILFELRDWQFFFDDLRDHLLRPGGRLMMKMITQDDFSGLKYEDPELQDYFRSRGAELDDDRRAVFFDGLL